MLGKNCARAFPTLAVAEASCASWRLISGRCVSNSDGNPGVTRGGEIWLSEPPVTCTLSGGRATRCARAFMFSASVLRPLRGIAVLAQEIEFITGAER